MAYPENGGVLKYFMPIAGLAAGAITVLEQLDIGAASGDHGEMLCIKPCVLRRVGFVPIAEAVSGTTTAPTVVFTKRPTPLSATGEAVAGTLTVPSGTAIGAPVFKDVTPVYFQPGDSMEVSWTVGVGTPTGIGTWFAEFHDCDELPANVSGYVSGA